MLSYKFILMRIKDFVHEHFKHFNAAALVDAASGYEKHLKEGKNVSQVQGSYEYC